MLRLRRAGRRRNDPAARMGDAQARRYDGRVRPSFNSRQFGRPVAQLTLTPARAGLTRGHRAEPGTTDAPSPR